LRGISLSGPALADGAVKSLSIFAAFFASDFKLCGIGVLTIVQAFHDIPISNIKIYPTIAKIINSVKTHK
jgi:hypothetical protein